LIAWPDAYHHFLGWQGFEMRRVCTLVTACAFALFSLPLCARECATTLFAELPMRIDSAGAVTVPMRVGDQVLNMVVDTGGVGSMLTADAVKRIGARPYNIFDGVPANKRLEIIGYQGTRVVSAANVPDIALGRDKHGGPMFLFVSPNKLPPGDDGILSNDILKNYDIEFDFANDKFRMYDLGHCDGAPRALFSEPIAEVPMSTDKFGHILITAKLDGREMEALVDTGFWRSTADWETIQNLFHLTETSPSVTASADLKGQIATYRYPFQTLDIEGMSVRIPDIVLAPRALSNMRNRQPDLILGIDILRHLHIYIDHRDRAIYLGSASR
jgi:hypothetical protein